jgi:hypothetical protein
MQSLRLVAVLLTLFVFGCDQSRPPPPASKKAILIVTWLVPGQPPETTQTLLSSEIACKKALAATEEAGARAKAERERLNADEKAEAIAQGRKDEAQLRARNPNILSVGPSLENQRKLRGVEPPQVAAYCINQ